MVNKLKKNRPLSTNVTSSRTVSNLHKNNVGKVSNKWSSYLAYYDQLFDPIKNLEVRLLEIGIQNGGSLEIWAQYFKNAKVIVGCDVDERCKSLSFDDKKISIIVENANSDPGYKQIASHAPFDVIIDDGSHLSEDIMLSFLNYFQFVKPGGIYVVEDTHAVYMKEATNINSKYNVFGFFKQITDLINFEFWYRDKNLVDLFSSYLNVAPPNWILEGWIESIEFRNSIITIKKSISASHNKLGYMEISGNIAEIDPEPLRVRDILANRALEK